MIIFFLFLFFVAPPSLAQEFGPYKCTPKTLETTAQRTPNGESVSITVSIPLEGSKCFEGQKYRAQQENLNLFKNCFTFSKETGIPSEKIPGCENMPNR